MIRRRHRRTGTGQGLASRDGEFTKRISAIDEEPGVCPGHHGNALQHALASLGRLPEQSVTRASSAVRIFQQLGGSLGVAIVAVVLQHHTENVIADAGGSPSPDQLASAFGNVFWWTIAFATVAVIPALLLPRTLHDDAAPAPREPATIA